MGNPLLYHAAAADITKLRANGTIAAILVNTASLRRRPIQVRPASHRPSWPSPLSRSTRSIGTKFLPGVTGVPGAERQRVGAQLAGIRTCKHRPRTFNARDRGWEACRLTRVRGSDTACRCRDALDVGRSVARSGPQGSAGLLAIGLAQGCLTSLNPASELKSIRTRFSGSRLSGVATSSCGRFRLRTTVS
jgi:hypothetical protein